MADLKCDGVRCDALLIEMDFEHKLSYVPFAVASGLQDNNGTMLRVNTRVRGVTSRLNPVSRRLQVGPPSASSSVRPTAW